jgi:hypothetical protein
MESVGSVMISITLLLFTNDQVEIHNLIPEDYSCRKINAHKNFINRSQLSDPLVGPFRHDSDFLRRVPFLYHRSYLC